MNKRQILTMTVMVVMAVFMSINVWAVPQLVNFQGKVTDNLGECLDGTYDMTFYLYLVESGGASEWSEVQNVMVADCMYGVQLGSETAFPPDLFDNEDLYLEVAIYNPDTTSWETLSPRQQITSTAFAMKAEVAEGVVSGAINTEMLSDSAITSEKIGNGEVGESDLQDGATLAEITDNDGTGSGLDADLLDGLSASAFATVGHSHDSRYYTKAEVDNLVSSFETRITQLENLLEDVTRDQNDITFDGMNVHITNGTGTTDGTVNGRGNLILGYNEIRGGGDDRSGSHNIVVGQEQNYSSYGGLIAGYRNTISAAYASVSGGDYNTASGQYSSVSGGYHNEANGFAASICGGGGNKASEVNAVVSGGYNNEASGSNSSVSGGDNNTASGNYSSVSGGRSNEASGYYSFVGGGGSTFSSPEGNEAFANYSAILGGINNLAGDPDLTDHTIGENSTVSGGQSNTASGDSSSVSGGFDNSASAGWSSVSGGQDNTASWVNSSVSGGLHNTASGFGSSVSGGSNNIAFANYSAILGGTQNRCGDPNEEDYDIGLRSTISGGRDNNASGDSSSVSGGYNNKALGDYSFVGGGGSYNAPWGNYAVGHYSAILGGSNNTAGDSNRTDTSIGNYSCVSGGRNNDSEGGFSTVGGGATVTAPGDDDWAAGGLWQDN